MPSSKSSARLPASLDDLPADHASSDIQAGSENGSELEDQVDPGDVVQVGWDVPGRHVRHSGGRHEGARGPRSEIRRCLEASRARSPRGWETDRTSATFFKAASDPAHLGSIAARPSSDRKSIPGCSTRTVVGAELAGRKVARNHLRADDARLVGAEVGELAVVRRGPRAQDRERDQGQQADSERIRPGFSDHDAWRSCPRCSTAGSDARLSCIGVGPLLVVRRP